MACRKIVPNRNITGFPLVAHLNFRNFGHFIRKLDEGFRMDRLIALNPVHIGIANEQAGPTSGMVANDRRVHGMFPVRHDPVDNRRIAKVMPQHQIDRVMLNLDIFEEQLERMGKPLIGGVHACPHGVCPERHLLRLQDRHDIGVLAGQHIMVPKVGC